MFNITECKTSSPFYFAVVQVYTLVSFHCITGTAQILKKNICETYWTYFCILSNNREDNLEKPHLFCFSNLKLASYQIRFYLLFHILHMCKIQTSHILLVCMCLPVAPPHDHLMAFKTHMGLNEY